MAQLTILRSYAQRPDPTTLPGSVLFAHNEKTLTIFDAYPKSIFHFLVLPRAKAYEPKEEGGWKVEDLKDLRTVLGRGREKARKVLQDLEIAARECKDEIEEEMSARYGHKWDIWIGFHPVPSMNHIHLHVLSADLCSDKMKHKKHYNSFHPKGDFFLKLETVMEWLDAEKSYFRTMAKLNPKDYEPHLKEDLVCFHENCGRRFTNFQKLKDHLQAEYNKLKEKAIAKKAILDKLTNAKRKRETQERDGTPSTVASTSGSYQDSKNVDEEAVDSQPEKRRKSACNAS
ncbi:HIT-like domain-containing protein [Cristinia sonorae]|uniref:HIT-like domain-containing protein n=1 Tax=Cristinia sonorae TaxID=1940300 RepID=A0A8K0UYK6_9AGAR|nr:HIT-like domain-containing protein [Cristinia sonorae]